MVWYGLLLSCSADVASGTLPAFNKLCYLHWTRRYLAAGRWVGALFGVVALMSVLLLRLAQWWQPASAIDVAPDWPARHSQATCGGGGGGGTGAPNNMQEATPDVQRMRSGKQAAGKGAVQEGWQAPGGTAKRV